MSFDKSRLLIGVGLVVVAGMTYFALSGGDDAVEQTEPWQAGSQSAVVQSSDEQPGAEVDLWPSDQISQDGSNSQPQPQIQPQQAATDEGNLAAGPVWPTGDEATQAANPLDANAMPAADYSFNGPEMTPPANGTGYVVPSDDGSTSGWPAETTPSAPVTGWPDDSTDTAPSSPGRVYQSQPAGYTAPVAGPDTYGQAPVRTGSLDAATYPGNNANVAAPTTSGSQLNGTIDIPRPRANNEYNGSSIY